MEDNDNDNDIVGNKKISVLHNEEKGRYCLANQNIAVGEEILRERAFVLVPIESYESHICQSCFLCVLEGSHPIKVDAFTYYCSQKCQKADQAQYNLISRALDVLDVVSKKCDVDKDLLRASLRIAAKGMVLEENGVSEQTENDLLQFKQVLNMVSHKENFDSDWLSVVAKAFESLAPYLDPALKMKYSQENLLDFACKINMNSHGLVDNSGGNFSIGFGVFPKIALINHSCQPNVCFTPENGYMIVRAIENINKGDEICLSYVDCYQSTDGRRELLLKEKKFFCTCKRCKSRDKDDLVGGIMCLNYPNCEGIFKPIITEDETSQKKILTIFDRVLKCSVCGLEISGMNLSGQVEKAVQLYTIGFRFSQQRHYSHGRDALENKLLKYLPPEKKRVDKGKGKKIETEKTTLKIDEIFLHPKHAVFFNAYSTLMNCCRAEGDLLNAIKYCKEVLSCMDAVFPTFYPEKANYYQALSELIQELLNSKSAKLTKVMREKYIKEAKDAIKKCVDNRVTCFGQDDIISQKLTKAKIKK